MSAIGDTSSAYEQFAEEAVEVNGPPDLDALGRRISCALDGGGLTYEQAGLLLSQAIPGSRVVNRVVAKRASVPFRQRHGNYIEEEILQRLRKKIDTTERGSEDRSPAEPYLDWSRLASCSTAAWVFKMSTLLYADVIKKMHRAGMISMVSIDDTLSTEAMIKAETTEARSELERRTEILREFEEATLDAKGNPRRMTQAAKLHHAAAAIIEMGDLPAPVRPLTWREREQVRTLLTENPGMAHRSLVDEAADAPVALQRMWDTYGEATRLQLAENSALASIVALSAVTPFPRPARETTINKFRRAVRGLSNDPHWVMSQARETADAWLGVFMDTTTYQSRASDDLAKEREAFAEEGRAVWDRMMRSNRAPLPVRHVAATTLDLSEVFVQIWAQETATPVARLLD